MLYKEEYFGNNNYKCLYVTCKEAEELRDRERTRKAALELLIEVTSKRYFF